MIVPQLLADYPRFNPNSSQSETQRSQTARVWEDVALLHRLLESKQSTFEDNHEWSTLETLQSEPLRQGLRGLHDVLMRHLSGRIQNMKIGRAHV